MATLRRCGGERGAMRRFEVRAALAVLALSGLGWFAAGVRAAERVEFASLDRTPSGAPVALIGHWFPSSRSPAPAVVLLHGCGGPYDANGQISARMRGYAALINEQGFHGLVLDSFTPRGERELCTQRIGRRAVTQVNRHRDALAALAWLAVRPDVMAERIGLLGWSNGGSTVLAATNMLHPEVRAAQALPAFAVAFYPGCESELKRGYDASARLLLLVGEADDWTPAEPCKRLAALASGRAVAIEVYADAYHGFDSNAPVRLLRNVPNGVHPGQGVHVGGDPLARQRSREALLGFIAAP